MQSTMIDTASVSSLVSELSAVNLSHELPVFKASYLLPFKLSYPGCDIETREEIKLQSDEIVHAFELQGQLFVSAELYEHIKALPTSK